MKRSPQNRFLDKAHKGFVLTCIGLTFYGSWLLGLRAHHYFTVIRPAIKEAELRKIEDSRNLETFDKAPELKA